MRSPLTGVVFALELTRRYEALLPLLIGATAAYVVSILVLRRSVLTEKIARRGLHLSREYSVDPLEVLFVEEVMESGPAAEPPPGEPPPVVAHADDTLRHVAYAMAEHGVTTLPVVDRRQTNLVLGTVTLEQLLQARLRDLHEERHSERVLRPRDLIGFGRGGRTEEAVE
jgi:chloride channel protein, CIC family